MSEFRSLEDAFDYIRILQKPVLIPEIKTRTWKPKTRERIDGGDPVRTPIDRVAARVVAPAPWWALPPNSVVKKNDPVTKQNKTKKKKVKKMSENEVILVPKESNNIPGQTYTSEYGLTVRMVNGKAMFDIDEVNAMICSEVAKLPKEIRPNVKAAEDARQIIAELTQGLGGEMEKFRADAKRYLEDIRSTRFAMVTETSQMTGSLKEVRQFFLGGDYKEEIFRLKEFVDLCERLHSLKESGFLDQIADTMLRLSIK